MAILKIKDDTGNIIDIPAIRGKSSYEYAQEGGFKGTEEEFKSLLGGLQDWADNALESSSNVSYATCDTEAEIAEKTVTISNNDNWKLNVGTVVMIYFSISNSASNVKLNVNGTGAYPIWYNNAEYTSTGTAYTGYAKRVIVYMFNGTHWVWISSSYDTNTTYTNASLGQGYATCSTAASTTAKVGALSSYKLVTGGIVSVKFTNAVPANATLNVNSTGAKAIYYRGAKITADVIKAGDVATFIYSSQYHLISIDRWQNDITSLEKTIADQREALGMKQPVGDYLTEIPAEYVTEEELAEELAELKAQGIQQTPLFANNVDECTDFSKVYVLPDGMIYAPQLVEVSAVDNILAKAQTSATDTTPFNGTGYQKDLCFTNSAGTEDASGFATQMSGGTNFITGFIPITLTEKLYFDKAYLFSFSSSRFFSWFYDSKGTKLVQITPNQILNGTLTSAVTMGANNNVVCLDLAVLQTITSGNISKYIPSAKFVRFSLQTDGSDPSEAVIAKEPIGGSTEQTYQFASTGIPFVTTSAINSLAERTEALETGLEELQGTQTYDIKVIAPPKITGLVGHELNIYTDNMFLCDNIKNYEIRWSFTGNLNGIAIAHEDCLRIPATTTSAMSDIATLRVREKTTGNLIKTIQIPIELIAEPTITGKKVLFIGDSLTEATYYPAEIQNNLSNGGITSLGSRSNYIYIDGVGMRVPHEGRSGWSVNNYLNAQSYNGATNEFYNPSTSKFDFSYYMTQKGYTGLNAVCIALGTNGVTSITENVNGINTMIESIHSYDSNIKVFVALTTPSALQDGWRSIQSVDEWKRQQLALVEAYINAFGSRTDNVGVIPWYIAINREYDFPYIEVAESARNPVVITRLNNNVHPSVYGYLKLADMTYYTLCANL